MNGQKFDGGKPRTDLLPTLPMMQTASVLAHGAEKYAANNWRAGIDQSRVYGAILRHLFAYWDGEEIDPDSGLPHLAHAMCELMFLMEFAAKPYEYAAFDDRYLDKSTKVYVGVDMAVPDEDAGLPIGGVPSFMGVDTAYNAPAKKSLFANPFATENKDASDEKADSAQ